MVVTLGPPVAMICNGLLIRKSWLSVYVPVATLIVSPAAAAATAAGRLAYWPGTVKVASKQRSSSCSKRAARFRGSWPFRFLTLGIFSKSEIDLPQPNENAHAICALFGEETDRIPLLQRTHLIIPKCS